jgi:tetratricopeptide (TPR) repeat protein
MPRFAAPLVAILAVCLTLAGAAPSPEAQTPSASSTVAGGLAALRSGHADQALADFQHVLAADPSNAAACLYAATAALELYNGPIAVQYAEKARHLDPQDWKVDTTLVAAYAAAGDKPQRDALRAQLRQLHSAGGPGAPDARDARLASGFLLEMFPVEYRPPAGPAQTWHVDAIEYFEPMGELRTWYRFLVRHSTGGPQLWEIDVQSKDFDETSWAKAHPSEAASGTRQFQISGHNDAGQEVDYRLFTGHDDYDAFRAMVVSILRSELLPGPSVP